MNLKQVVIAESRKLDTPRATSREKRNIQMPFYRLQKFECDKDALPLALARGSEIVTEV